LNSGSAGLLQESLTNIQRHSGSETAQISISREADRIHVLVRDDGKGMSEDRLAEIQSKGSGVGIRGMRERQLQGELTVESNALGTTISATFLAKALTPSGERAIQPLDVA